MSNWTSQSELSVLGTGFALPGPAIDTRQLFELVLPHAPGLSERAVKAASRRLGIKHRHISRSFAARSEGPCIGMRNPDIAARAVTSALDEARLLVSDLGYLIGHTTTPAQPLPSNIAFVADILGYAGPHVELRQACTGFANALMIAFGLLAQPYAKPVAIVGSETGSVFFDPASAVDNSGQRVNLVQMGDGAGAIILGPAQSSQHILRSAWYGTTGLGKTPGIAMLKGGSDNPNGGNGPLYFEQDYSAIGHAGPALFAAGVEAAKAQGLSSDSVDWIIPHQASGRIGTQLAHMLEMPESKVFVNADRVGNAGSAAIWLALAQLRAEKMSADESALVLGAEATKYMHGGFEYRHG